MGSKLTAPKIPHSAKITGGKNTLLPPDVITRQCKFNSNEAKGTPLTCIPSKRARSCRSLSLRKYWELKETIMRDRPCPRVLYALHTGRGGLNGSLSGTPGGPVFPAQQHLALRKRARWGACGVNGPVLQRVTLNGQLLQTMLCRPPEPHTCTQTRARNTHLCAHTKATHVGEPSPFHLSLSLSYLYSGFVSPNWSWWGTNW